MPLRVSRVLWCTAAQEDAARILGLEPAATKAVRKAAQPFVDWLAEEEDDESDEE